ncbi:MAG: gliding motility-associated C-terminal domain-containing protein [Cyclobacteriaceae bacterium]|nr:gliding motility-associated C-terminal domain-containing protein [Cyclobacteriaceae bacterium]
MLFRKAFLLSVLIGLNHVLFAQNESNIWFLGNGIGLNFSDQPPEILENAPQPMARYGSIADSLGNLVLYCDHNTVWNANHEIVLNGTGLNGSRFGPKYILRKPGQSHLYYIIQLNSAHDSQNNGVLYSLIDIKAGEGRGEVIKKNEVIYNRLHGFFDISGNCEGSYWLVGEHDTNTQSGIDTDRILAFKIDENGIASEPVISMPTYMGNSSNYKFSPKGDKIFFSYSAVPEPDLAVVADFNTTTGGISNLRSVGECCASAEFSPSGRYLYTLRLSAAGVSVHQIDLEATVPMPRLVAGLFDTFISSMQLAPDGKIYALINGTERMFVIKNPNDPFEELQHSDSLNLAFQNSISGIPFLPTFPSHLLYDGELRPDAGPDVEICSGESVRLGVPKPEISNYEWSPAIHLDNPNSASPLFSWENPTDSSVVFMFEVSSCQKDLVKVTVHPSPRPEIAGPASVCPGVDSVLYVSNPEGLENEWSQSGGSLISENAGDSILINWGGTNPNAHVRLQSRNAYGCISDEVLLPVRINVELQTQTPMGAEDICKNQAHELLYQVYPSHGSQYHWGAKGGTISYGENGNRIIVNWKPDQEEWLLWVQEESITRDTVCFGVSDTLRINLFQDSLQVMIHNVSLDSANESEAIIKYEVLNASAEAPNPAVLSYQPGHADNWMPLYSFIAEDLSSDHLHEGLQSHETIYRYILESVNGCEEEVISQMHNTILLNGFFDERLEEIQLTWNPYENWENGVKAYHIYRRLDGESQYSVYFEANGDIHGINIPDLTDGLEHQYRIKAISYDGDKFSWSNIIGFSFDHPLTIPNVFTPNGDGINDFFEVVNLHLYPENELVVINRWGKEVFRQYQYDNSWDGDGLSHGVYYYQLNVPALEQTYQGWLKVEKE